MDFRESYRVCQGEDNIYLDPTYKWHARFLQMAALVGSWSKDPSTKSGAVIVDNKQRVVATGYNGLPRGIQDSHIRLHTRELKYDLTMHSELNAILFAKTHLDGFAIYSTPIPPCIRCAVAIIQSGIKHVICTPLHDDQRDRWQASVDHSKEMFREAGLTYLEISI